jgi:hypothetical protein
MNAATQAIASALCVPMSLHMCTRDRDVSFIVERSATSNRVVLVASFGPGHDLTMRLSIEDAASLATLLRKQAEALVALGARAQGGAA